MKFAKSLTRVAFVLPSLVAPAVLASAADAPPPPENTGWVGSIGAGLAITSGNTDTKTINFGGVAASDAKKRNVVKLDGLYIRTSTDGDTTVNRTGLGVRDEYALGKRSFAFGEVRFLRDEFKGISHLISPLVGVGYKLVDQEKVHFQVDAAVGAAFETPVEGDSTNSGAYHFGEAFVWKLSPTSTFGQSATGLWKTKDSSDALYRFEASLAVSVSSRFELKVSFADEYKNKPTSATLKKNDTALLTNIVYKF